MESNMDGALHATPLCGDLNVIKAAKAFEYDIASFNGNNSSSSIHYVDLV